MSISDAAVPLVVDLDGTLLRGDTLHEVVFGALFSSPIAVLRAFGAMSRGGKGAFKAAVSPVCAGMAARLPARREILELIDRHREDCGRVILATGAHRSIAEAVARRFGVFDEVLATESSGENFIGDRKRDELVRRYGSRGFDYVGDSRADLPVWGEARNAYVVGRLGDGTLRLAGRSIERIAPAERDPRVWKALRPHQWVKNLLVFLPVLAAHRIADMAALAASALAFCAFSAAASLVYLVNDLADRDSDRSHRSKRRRPIAWGNVGPLHALVVAAGLVVILVGLCAFLPVAAGAAISVYLSVNLAYSLHFKKRLLVDVFLLAWMYVWRVVTGGAATGIHLTSWLLGFSGFAFLSLALAKRYAEVVRLDTTKEDSAKGRAWKAGDALVLMAAGVGSGFGGALVLALYVTGDSFTKFYRNPNIAMLLAPLFLYWNIRIWIQAVRLELHEDPVIFAAKDQISYGVLAVAVLILAAAMV